MRQVFRVLSHCGKYFVLYELPRDGTWPCRYAILAEDGAGNGEFIAYGDNEARLRDLILNRSKT